MDLLLTVILQIAVILTVSRAVGLLFRRFRQPQVLGEMTAGLMLGPSLLGWLLPGASAALFPPDSLVYLNVLSQIGLLLFMFLVGLELDPALLRGRGRAAFVTSNVSIVAPFVLGALLAIYLHPRLSDASVPFTGFALFMGAAMSITAFPVLARILVERNMLQTKVGALTVTSAAVNDVTAWCILALLIAIVRADETQHPFWLTIAGTSLYAGVMVLPVRRAMAYLERVYIHRGRVSQDLMALILLLLLASAWTTHWLGIHALFGAFVLGVVMPKDRAMVHELTEKLEHVTVVFLLPLFFASAGLRASIGLLTGIEMWFYCVLILVVAIVGKFGGSAIAARLTGLSWREAGALGILMNTRGLVELVILTIGLDLGVITPVVYTMMVIMAIATTFMAAPILEWIYPARLVRAEMLGGPEPRRPYTVLLPVSLASAGPGLLRLASMLAPASELQVYALHLSRGRDEPLGDLSVGPSSPQAEALRPLLHAAQSEGVTVRPLVFVSRDTGGDICDTAHVKGAQLILMGWHKPVLSRSILSGTVYEVMLQARADVCVYQERHFRLCSSILVPYRKGVHDLAAIGLAERIARHHGVEITILHVVDPGTGAGEAGLRAGLGEDVLAAGNVRLKVVESRSPLEVAVETARSGFDLIIVGISDAWGMQPTFFAPRHEWLARETGASLLVVRKYVPPAPAARPS